MLEVEARPLGEQPVMELIGRFSLHLVARGPCSTPSPTQSSFKPRLTVQYYLASTSAAF